MFREWIYIVSTIIIMFGFIVRIMQLLLKIKKNVNYYDYKNIFVAGNQKKNRRNIMARVDLINRK